MRWILWLRLHCTATRLALCVVLGMLFVITKTCGKHNASSDMPSVLLSGYAVLMMAARMRPCGVFCRRKHALKQQNIAETLRFRTDAAPWAEVSDELWQVSHLTRRIHHSFTRLRDPALFRLAHELVRTCQYCGVGGVPRVQIKIPVRVLKIGFNSCRT